MACRYAEFLRGKGKGDCPTCGIPQPIHDRECFDCGEIIYAEDVAHTIDCYGCLVCDKCWRQHGE